MPGSFVHLHLHTEFSLLDGMIRAGQAARRAAELGMPAVAMTDHGNLYGAVEFYKSCHKEGVKPLMGCEIYLAPQSMHEKKELPGRKRATHLTLLAETNEGWGNLSKLVSKGHLEGLWHGKPRVDLDALATHAKGLICLSGCISGPVNEWLIAGDEAKARDMLGTLSSIFGPRNTFVEVHDHGLAQQRTVLPALVRLARDLELPLVAANDVHFLGRGDHEAHDVMICIGTGHLLADAKRMRYTPEAHFKTPEEMRALFAELPEACDNTLAIAERCHVELALDPTSSDKYPQFGTPDGSPREQYLLQLCSEGLVNRYGAQRAADPAVRQRLEYEVGVINQLGFASYFLITADFISWARSQGIPVGPGRGSAAGSLAAYALGITNICPLRFGLLFERFLNPERVSPPDVDIDFCQSRRGEVIDYVRRKYGERSVSHIITYGTLGAKSVVRDVARVMGLSYGDGDRLSKMIDPRPVEKDDQAKFGSSILRREFERNTELRETVEASDSYRELWRHAVALEGLTRNVGIHAAGIVIGDRPLDEHVPLTRGNEGEVVTQFDMGAITEVGLLKMDFLGLRNLTVIREAEGHLRARLPDFNVEKVPDDDERTFALLNRGETMGVFQLESGGMVETCRKYQIASIDDITDLLALYRPGAMQFIDRMIEVKKGRRKPVYEHPLLETVCGNTYGVMIYQEQVQNAAKLLAGYTLGGADLLRRAMGKKDQKKMAEERGRFIEGAAKVNDIAPELAGRIFDKIQMFADYGFNKSHSACYAHISYWTAWLKANHPVEFMAALLSNEIHDTDKIGVFVSECHRMGIAILAPDLNASRLRFAPEQREGGSMAIRYGLAAIKNCGEGAMAAAVAERDANGPFRSLEDFASRLDPRVVNKRILENLVKAGAFDWTGETRAAMAARLEQVTASVASAHRDRAAGQVSLFGEEDLGSSTRPASTATPAGEWPKEERLAHERELLGFYVTGHPLDRFRGVIDSDRFRRLGLVDDLDISNQRERFPFAGMVRSLEGKVTRSGKPFGVLVLEDFTGSAEVMLWGETFVPARDAGLLEPGSIIRLKCAVQVDDRTGGRRLTGYEVEALKPPRATASGKGSLELELSTIRHTTRDLDEILAVLRAHPGKSPVLLHFHDGKGGRITVAAGDDCRVRRSDALTSALGRWNEV